MAFTVDSGNRLPLRKCDLSQDRVERTWVPVLFQNGVGEFCELLRSKIDFKIPHSFNHFRFCNSKYRSIWDGRASNIRTEGQDEVKIPWKLRTWRTGHAEKVPDSYRSHLQTRRVPYLSLQIDASSNSSRHLRTCCTSPGHLCPYMHIPLKRASSRLQAIYRLQTIYTARSSPSISLHAFEIRAMSTETDPRPSALTFDLIARCSVGRPLAPLHVRMHIDKYHIDRRLRREHLLCTSHMDLSNSPFSCL